MNIDTIKAHFSIIRGERQSPKVDYPVFDILFSSICAVIAEGQCWADIREYVLATMNGFLSRACLKMTCLLMILLSA
ncbi:transposase family protein [Shewanella mesophila]|nr:transposase family protein [Shewanella mesophila]QYJ86015.1 transposase family protein [Shewanella mesophila]